MKGKRMLKEADLIAFANPYKCVKEVTYIEYNLFPGQRVTIEVIYNATSYGVSKKVLYKGKGRTKVISEVMADIKREALNHG